MFLTTPQYCKKRFCKLVVIADTGNCFTIEFSGAILDASNLTSFISRKYSLMFIHLPQNMFSYYEVNSWEKKLGRINFQIAFWKLLIKKIKSPHTLVFPKAKAGELLIKWASIVNNFKTRFLKISMATESLVSLESWWCALNKKYFYNF